MEETPKYEGLDEAIVGVAYVWQRHPGGGATRVKTLIYDGERIAHLLMERDGMAPEDVHEYIDYNIEGGYLGEATPIIMWPHEESE